VIRVFEYPTVTDAGIEGGYAVNDRWIQAVGLDVDYADFSHFVDSAFQLSGKC